MEYFTQIYYHFTQLLRVFTDENKSICYIPPQGAVVCMQQFLTHAVIGKL